jgi:F420-dependent oxidoreductase-like protein
MRAPIQLDLHLPNFNYPGVGPEDVFDRLVDIATTAERAGFSAVTVMDHYHQIPPVGPPQNWMFEGNTMLAGLAARTRTIALGLLVGGVTYRNPAQHAKITATLDIISRGRAFHGIGAGWFQAEHTAYGIPFPSLGERFDRYEEQLAVITGLWNTPPGETFDFRGTYYQLSDSPALPKPVQAGGIPMLVGGAGKKRTPRLAARYASEFNVPFSSAEDNARLFAGVREACEEAGRDPSSLVYSSALVLCVGKDEAEIARRAAAIGRDVEELREHGVAGTPAEAVDIIGRYAEAGSQRFYLQVLDLSDLDHLDLVASEVAPQLG